MTSADHQSTAEHTCDPQWVAFNHLFSYCAKAGRTTVQQDGERTQREESAGCKRKRCLFVAPQG